MFDLSYSPKQLIYVINALDNIFLFQFLESLFYHCFVAVLYDAHKLLGTELAEVPLHLRKAKLHRIVILRVWNVEDPTEAKLFHSLLGTLRCMG